MPHNLLNKKQWLAELESLSNTYIDFINKLTSSKDETGLDIVLSKKYKSNDLVFMGQEIVDNIQKKLADDTNYVYEFKVIDNRPVVKRLHRVSFDNLDIPNIKGDNMIVTIEDLKSKYTEALMKISMLTAENKKKDAENHLVFLDAVEAYGGLYNFVSKKKLILMFSRILKELGFYNDEKGSQYSYDTLDSTDKLKVINTLYTKVYVNK